ncbi:MAG: radical SAM protein [Microgenomates group bacterium]
MSSVSNIGFYTLTDERAIKEHFNMERCEIIITEMCNYKCPYCRGVKAYSRDCSGHLHPDIVKSVLNSWISSGLKNIRFSGGEPTMHPNVVEFVKIAKEGGIKRIAISSNGSMPEKMYRNLLDAGVNDFSISLDACCAEDAEKMSGGRKGIFERVASNIEWLSKETYVTVGIVLTDETQSTVVDVVKFAHDLGVSDIRIITAAQYNGALSKLELIPDYILEAHPILKYRVKNLLSGKNVRGISDNDTRKCHLVVDDSVVAGSWHFPCVIHMREGGEPIGRVDENMLEQRKIWSENHDTHLDPICKQNCLDCLVDYNNMVEEKRK